MTTSTLLTLGKTEPRRVVGTVNTAEFLVTTAAVAGFVVGLWEDLVANLAAVLALLVGGCIAAPVAAWLVSRMNPAALGGVVGTLLVLLNLPVVLAPFDVTPGVLWGLRLVVLVVGGSLALRGWLRARAALAAEPERRTTVNAEPTGTLLGDPR